MRSLTVSTKFRLRSSGFHSAGKVSAQWASNTSYSRPASTPRDLDTVDISKSSFSIFFRMNTCESLSKQASLNSFRINTYARHRGRGRLRLTSSLKRNIPLNRTNSFCSFAALAFLWVLSSFPTFGQAASTSSAPAGSLKKTTSNPATEPSDPQNAALADARALVQAGRINDADRLVRQYLETHPDSAEGHFLLGQILFREIQSEAKLETQPEGVQVLGANSLRATHAEEKAKASLAEFTAGARFHDPSASDLKTVAFDYVLLGDYVDADKWLTRMLEWTADDSEGWYYLGRAKYNENRFAEAVTAFQRSLSLDPANVRTEDNLGLSYAGLGRNEESLAAYKTAISWQAQAATKNPGPYIDLGSLLLDESRPEEAVSYLLQAIDIAPHESKTHELLGKAYTRLDQMPKAQTELEKAVELSPRSANLHCMLAPVYLKQGFTEKAKIESDRCAALAGSHSIPETP